MEKITFIMAVCLFCLAFAMLLSALRLYWWTVRLRKILDGNLKECWDLHDDVNIMHYEITQAYEAVTGKTWIARPVERGEK